MAFGRTVNILYLLTY